MSSGDRYLAAVDIACSLDADLRVREARRVPEGRTAEAWIGESFEDLVVARDRTRIRRELESSREHRCRKQLSCALTVGDEAVEYAVTIAAPGADDCATVLAIRREAGEEAEWRSLESLDRVHRVILGARTVEEMLSGVLDEMLEIFGCDRAWLLRPCDPEAESYTIRMERTRPEWPGAGAQAAPIPMNEFARDVFAAALERAGAHRFDPETVRLDVDDWLIAEFNIRSQLVIAVHPEPDVPWCLGIHHCAEPRVYTDDVALFEAISARVTIGLQALLARDEVRCSEERLRTLVQHAPEAIVICDFETLRFIDGNRNAERLFGLTREELLNVGPIETSPEFQPSGELSIQAIEREVRSAMEGNVPVFEWSHRNSRGEEIPCEVRLVRLPSVDRPLLRGSITDISGRRASEEQQRELEAQLRQAQKMEAIGHLTGGVAHDFNNILTAILGNTELALDALEAGSRSRRLLTEALSATQKGAILTQRLLAFSRKQALSPRAVDLAGLVHGMEDLLARSLGAHVEIEVVVGAGLWRCEADPVQLESAILNLAINARDAMSGGGHLTIEVSNKHLDEEYCARHGELAPGKYTMLAVSDDGTGMTPEVLARSFEPFFTTKDVGKGSGLGLSMVYGFVKQSRGHVKLYSELGHGSVVKLYLPRATEDTLDSTEPPASGDEPLGRGEWVLVVEDDASVRNYVVAALERLGYRTHHAGSGQRALEVLEGQAGVDLLLTDVVLPGGMNGVELARRAGQLRENLLVLYMSGYTENAIIHHGRLDPGVELLGKPFTKNELARRVRDVLDGSAV